MIRRLTVDQNVDGHRLEWCMQRFPFLENYTHKEGRGKPVACMVSKGVIFRQTMKWPGQAETETCLMS